jgi:hypothetical protein
MVGDLLTYALSAVYCTLKVLVWEKTGRDQMSESNFFVESWLRSNDLRLELGLRN